MFSFSRALSSFGVIKEAESREVIGIREPTLTIHFHSVYRLLSLLYRQHAHAPSYAPVQHLENQGCSYAGRTYVFSIISHFLASPLTSAHQLILHLARLALSTKIEPINVLDLPTWRAVPTTHECGGIRGVSRRPRPAASGSTLVCVRGLRRTGARGCGVLGFQECENIYPLMRVILFSPRRWPSVRPHPSTRPSLVCTFTWPKRTVSLQSNNCK